MTIRKLAASTAIVALLSAGAAYAQSDDASTPKGDEVANELNASTNIKATSTETRKVNGEVVETKKKTSVIGADDSDTSLDLNVAAQTESAIDTLKISKELTIGDATSAARQEFQAADVDDNGTLSKSEYVTLASAQQRNLEQASNMDLSADMSESTEVATETTATTTTTAEASTDTDEVETTETTVAMMEAEGEMEAELPEGAYGEGDVSVDETAKTTADASIKAEAEAQFDELADGKKEIAIATVLDERRKNFDEADDNADGILRGEELATYFELNAGLKSRA